MKSRKNGVGGSWNSAGNPQKKALVKCMETPSVPVTAEKPPQGKSPEEASSGLQQRNRERTPILRLCGAGPGENVSAHSLCEVTYPHGISSGMGQTDLGF